MTLISVKFPFDSVEQGEEFTELAQTVRGLRTLGYEVNDDRIGVTFTAHAASDAPLRELSRLFIKFIHADIPNEASGLPTPSTSNKQKRPRRQP
jgi:hypothetical protein